MSTSRQISSYETHQIPLDAITPYWRNPRRISDEAINAVAESIRRYGFNQPLVVDADNVIIVGHTRYAALRRLGMDTAEVHVAADLSPEKVREYRVLDNKVGEYTSWDFDSLMDELDGLKDSGVLDFFPEVGLIEDPGALDQQSAEPQPVAGGTEDMNAEFICPSCFHTFTVHVTLENVRKGRL